MAISVYHDPVMLKECINGLTINPDGIYVDVTFGGGGHSKSILENLNKGRLFAFDQDIDSAGNKLNDNRFTFIHHNFKYISNYLRYYKAIPIDGLMADLGVSSHQIDFPERGFSTRFDSQLDMRMDKDNTLTARDIINDYGESRLQQIFSQYGEIHNAKTLAQTIIKERTIKPINTVFELQNVVKYCINKSRKNQYLAQLFQALRIEVNNELTALKELLIQCNHIFKKGGKLVVLTYHSLEDRIVKNFMLRGNFEGIVQKDFYGNEIKPFQVVNKKPLIASTEEVSKNPRSRSAKLRIAEKI